MIIVADNINPMSPVVAEALEQNDGAAIERLACRCAASGAEWLDVNPGFLSTKRRDRVDMLVNAARNAAPDARLILDSPIPDVLARGLAACAPHAPVISALTLEPSKLEGILPLAAEHPDTDLVCLLLDERSLCPPGADDKMALAVALRGEAESAGVDPRRLIFDPVIPNLSWPDAHAHLDAAVQVVYTLASGDLFGEPARTMAGISNLLSGGLRRLRPAILEHDALRRLATAGLHIALLNVFNLDLMSVALSAGKNA